MYFFKFHEDRGTMYTSLILFIESILVQKQNKTKQSIVCALFCLFEMTYFGQMQYKGDYGGNKPCLLFNI